MHLCYPVAQPRPIMLEMTSCYYEHQCMEFYERNNSLFIMLLQFWDFLLFCQHFSEQSLISSFCTLGRWTGYLLPIGNHQNSGHPHLTSLLKVQSPPPLFFLLNSECKMLFSGYLCSLLRFLFTNFFCTFTVRQRGRKRTMVG